MCWLFLVMVRFLLLRLVNVLVFCVLLFSDILLYWWVGLLLRCVCVMVLWVVWSIGMWCVFDVCLCVGLGFGFDCGELCFFVGGDCVFD